jgi:hypothetical protein
MVSISRLQTKLAAGSAFARPVADRRRDNLRYQADAYARLGDKQTALDRLDEWAADSIWADDKQWLITDRNLVGLRNDPSFKTLVSRFDRLVGRLSTSRLTGLGLGHRINGHRSMTLTTPIHKSATITSMGPLRC